MLLSLTYQKSQSAFDVKIGNTLNELCYQQMAASVSRLDLVGMFNMASKFRYVFMHGHCSLGKR